jgi:hypothetical protein
MALKLDIDREAKKAIREDAVKKRAERMRGNRRPAQAERYEQVNSILAKGRDE